MQSQGRLYIIGIGPGGREHRSRRAEEAIREAEYIIGNKSYLELIEDLTKGKRIIKSRMGEEIDRAKRALVLSEEHKVAIVSGGDPNVYGMAGIVLEVAEKSGRDFDIEIIPGITSANAVASVLGAPLNNDFAVISLSDLLTPWEVIERNLSAVAEAEFVIVLYNPRSRSRVGNFKRAIEIIRRFRADDTPVGIVKNCTREGERRIITNLRSVLTYDDEVDMHTTVIIGNRESRIWKDWIITPRGYHRKYRI